MPYAIRTSDAIANLRGMTEPSPSVHPGVHPLPAIHRAFPGVFYGWVVVLGTALLAFVCVGIGFYSQAVLVDGLVEARGWSRSSSTLR